MKTLTLAAVLALFALPALADPVEGTWRTAKDDNGNFGDIKIVPCGAKYCGTLIQSYDSAGKPFKSENMGKKIVWDMVSYGGGSYGDGKIWSPDRDKTYDSKMALTGDTLTVKGCVFFICRDGGTWSRVK